jgi:hypothetical protein
MRCVRATCELERRRSRGLKESGDFLRIPAAETVKRSPAALRQQRVFARSVMTKFPAAARDAPISTSAGCESSSAAVARRANATWLTTTGAGVRIPRSSFPRDEAATAVVVDICRITAPVNARRWVSAPVPKPRKALVTPLVKVELDKMASLKVTSAEKAYR